MDSASARVVLVPLVAEQITHSADLDECESLVVEDDIGDANFCKTTLNTNGRPTMCGCGKLLYKFVSEPEGGWQGKPYADGETVG